MTSTYTKVQRMFQQNKEFCVSGFMGCQKCEIVKKGIYDSDCSDITACQFLFSEINMTMKIQNKACYYLKKTICFVN